MPEPRELALLASVALLGAGPWTGASAQQPNIGGTWEWTRKSGCMEQYVFRADGTASITRGEKRTESTYLMSWAPEPGGRYRLAVTTVRDLGGRDCDGSAADTAGASAIVYVLFSQSRESMIQCGSPVGADCTGLMRRTAR